MSHRSAPVALLEKLSMDESVRHQTALALIRQPALTESMIVSTCNSGWKMSPVDANKWMQDNMFDHYKKGDLKDRTKE